MLAQGTEATDLVVVLSAIGSTAWAVAAVWASVVSVRWRSIRRTAWPAVLIPEALLACWWAVLNVKRWASASYTSVEYRRDIYPIVPVLFLVMCLNLVVFVRRARITEQITNVIRSQDVHQKVTDGER